MKQQPLVTISLQEYEYLKKEHPIKVINSLVENSIFPSNRPNYFKDAIEQSFTSISISPELLRSAQVNLADAIEKRSVEIHSKYLSE